MRHVPAHAEADPAGRFWPWRVVAVSAVTSVMALGSGYAEAGVPSRPPAESPTSVVSVASVGRPTVVPLIRVTTAIGRQRIAVAGRVLSNSVPARPFTVRSTDASGLLAEALGPPIACRPTKPGVAGTTARIADYRRTRGLLVRAVLSADPGSQQTGSNLCAPGSKSTLDQLVLRGRGVIATDLGAIRLGARLKRHPRRLRGQLSAARLGIGVPVQDPCRDEPVPAQLGEDASLVSAEYYLGGRIFKVSLRPGIAAHCKSAPARELFTQNALANACALLGITYRKYSAGCGGGDVEVSVAPATPPVTNLEKPLLRGASTDGTARWSFGKRAGAVEGHGLRVELTSAGSNFDPDADGELFRSVADRLATGVDYAAQPDDYELYLTAVLRAARPFLVDVVVGIPAEGADAQAHTVYRGGQAIGFAAFLYDTDPLLLDVKPLLTYRLLGFHDSTKRLCRRHPRYFTGRCGR
jgi:hypothetical protein